MPVVIGPYRYMPDKNELAELDLEGFVFSAVILAIREGVGPSPSIDQVGATVRSLLEQESPEGMEILVVATEPFFRALHDVCSEAVIVSVHPRMAVAEVATPPSERHAGTGSGSSVGMKRSFLGPSRPCSTRTSMAMPW